VPPFASKSATEMLVMQITAEPPRLRQHVPDVPEYVEQSVMRALAKDREARFANVDYFVGALHGTYPALTAQGNAPASVAGLDGPPSGLLYSTHGFGYQRTPAPIPVGSFASRVGLTPGPVPVPVPVPVPAPSPTITTLSHATGEASPPPLPSESELDLEAVKPRRWPLGVVLGAAGAAAALFFVFRPASLSTPAGPAVAQKSPAVQSAPSEAMVRVRVQSSPAGASVLDERDGSALGMTPLQKSYPQAKGSVGMTLRLPGYKDKSIVVALDGNSSTTVELERMEAVPAEAAAKPAVTRTEPRKSGGAHKPPKPQHDEEDEWRVH
jgi:hypothetical protein